MLWMLWWVVIGLEAAALTVMICAGAWLTGNPLSPQAWAATWIASLIMIAMIEIWRGRHILLRSKP